MTSSPNGLPPADPLFPGGTPQPTPAANPVAMPQVVPDEQTELAGLRSQLHQLQSLGQNGASWFYWAAGLSLVNSVIALAGGNRRFIFGLGITQIVDAVGGAVAEENPGASGTIRGVAFGIALAIAAVMVLFGWLANKRMTPMFVLGMVLYLLDGLLLLLFQDWISLAFHAFVLYQMWQGLQAYRQLSAVLASQPAGSL